MEDTRTEAERAYDATRLSPLTTAEKRAIARQADQALAAHFARRSETEDANASIAVLSGLPAVNLETWQGDEDDDEADTVYTDFKAGTGLTEVMVGTYGGDKAGIELHINSIPLNVWKHEVITLADLAQIRDNITALLNDERLRAQAEAPALRPITVEKLYRDGSGDLVEEKCGPLAYVDYAIGINFEGGEHDDDRAWISFCVAENRKPLDYTCPMVGLCDGEALPLHLVERAFVNFQRLLADPRVQAMVKAAGTVE